MDRVLPGLGWSPYLILKILRQIMLKMTHYPIPVLADIHCDMKLMAMTVSVWLTAAPAFAQTAPVVMYVQAYEAPEYSQPGGLGEKVNTVYRRQWIHVYQVQDGWARISPLGYSPTWIGLEKLGDRIPGEYPTVESSAIFSDPRIEQDALPIRPQDGLNTHDVVMIWHAARLALRNGCGGIDLGDAYVNKPDTYYVHCKGELDNRFYTSGPTG
jgi:hypothetical protein